MQSKILPLVSIAVVVRNAAKELDATLNSIASQSYANKELVVVDGGSSDGTASMLRNRSDIIAKWISEPDRGVYDGMNKAAHLATGEYIIYMNAGDVFFSAASLADCMSFENIQPDVIVGQYMYIHRQNLSHIIPVSTARRIEFLRTGNIEQAFRNFVCHQATLTRRNLLCSLGGYNLQYSLLADQDFLLRAHEAGAIFHQSNAIICIYKSGGISSDSEESSRQFIKLFAKYADRKKLEKHLYEKAGHAERWRRRLVNVAIKIPQIRSLHRQRGVIAERAQHLESMIADEAIDARALSKIGASTIHDLLPDPKASALEIFNKQATFYGAELAPPEFLTNHRPGIHFVTFASGNPLLENSLARIGNEASYLGVFSSIALYTTKSLLAKYPDFSDYINFMTSNSRGYGFWIWKPFLLAKHLMEIPEGDILFYTDAGCELSVQGLPFFLGMVDSANRNGHLFFRMNQYPEFQWTKREVLNYFASELGTELVNRGQVAATTLFIKSTRESREFCEEWLRLSNADGRRLIDDSFRVSQNPEFREHRYDQSLLSCLIQARRRTNVLDSDLFFAYRSPLSWRQDLFMLEFPIFWSHRKYDFDDFSEINLKVEWFKLHAYHFLAKAQGSGKENETVSFLRHRLVAAYAELRR